MYIYIHIYIYLPTYIHLYIHTLTYLTYLTYIYTSIIISSSPSPVAYLPDCRCSFPSPSLYVLGLHVQ